MTQTEEADPAGLKSVKPKSENFLPAAVGGFVTREEASVSLTPTFPDYNDDRHARTSFSPQSDSPFATTVDRLTVFTYEFPTIGVYDAERNLPSKDAKALQADLITGVCASQPIAVDGVDATLTSCREPAAEPTAGTVASKVTLITPEPVPSRGQLFVTWIDGAILIIIESRAPEAVFEDVAQVDWQALQDAAVAGAKAALAERAKLGA
jgi:hypothetical protein